MKKIKKKNRQYKRWPGRPAKGNVDDYRENYVDLYGYYCTECGAICYSNDKICPDCIKEGRWMND